MCLSYETAACVQHSAVLHERRDCTPSTGFMKPSCAILAQAAAIPGGERRKEGREFRAGEGVEEGGS